MPGSLRLFFESVYVTRFNPKLPFNIQSNPILPSLSATAQADSSRRIAVLLSRWVVLAAGGSDEKVLSLAVCKTLVQPDHQLFKLPNLITAQGLKSDISPGLLETITAV